jgi:hypothetical protein
MADVANTTIPSRRAILTGIPAAAMGVGAMLPAAATAATINKSTMARLVREWMAVEARAHAAFTAHEDGGPYPNN